MSTVSSQRPGTAVRARLLDRGARRWYLGTIFGLSYQVAEIVYVWTLPEPVAWRILATSLLAVFYAGYVMLPPLVWPQSVRTRVLALTAYWLATFILLPFLGAYLVWIWPLVVAMIAFCWLPIAAGLLLSATIAAVQVGIASLNGYADGTGFSPFVTATVAISLFSITNQIVANQKLRDAQATIATLAAAEERARLARDLHDVLGHSLTVVAVKSELAGRLVDRDPRRAAAEIADIEALARTALADLRAAVSSYRETNLDSELAAARTALDAAGIRLHLPSDGSTVEEQFRPLFGWVLREGVTNVIRHSNATQCWVELGPRSMSVSDDGRGDGGRSEHRRDDVGGAASLATSSGNGLAGLRERAVEAGARLTTGNNDTGGFVLTVASSTP